MPLCYLSTILIFSKSISDSLSTLFSSFSWFFSFSESFYCKPQRAVKAVFDEGKQTQQVVVKKTAKKKNQLNIILAFSSKHENIFFLQNCHRVLKSREIKLQLNFLVLCCSTCRDILYWTRFHVSWTRKK